MAGGRIKTKARELLRPVTQLVVDLGVPPGAITFAGLLLSVLAGVSIATGHFPSAGILLAFAGICDMIDGAAARAGNRATKTGAFLDSTVDRYSEIVVLLGALIYYLARSPAGPEVVTGVVVFLALAGSLMVSYTRARAEAVGRRCEIGWAERPERVVLLVIGALFGANVFRVVVWILAALAHLTAVQRVRHVLTSERE